MPMLLHDSDTRCNWCGQIAVNCDCGKKPPPALEAVLDRRLREQLALSLVQAYEGKVLVVPITEEVAA